MTHINSLIPQLKHDLQHHASEKITLLLNELQPYDLAEVYTLLPENLQLTFINELSNWQTAALIQELESQEQLKLLRTLDQAKTTAVLDLMENDDLADMLANVSTQEANALLAHMKQEESSSVQRLLSYEPESAGGIMTNRFVWVHSTDTVRQAVDKIKRFAEYAENIYYLYVLDQHKKLVGVTSYRDLVLADEHDRIQDLMKSRVISVPVDTDQEEVARMIERYDFVALPVVDHEQKLVGIITVDDIIDVIVDEANEDIEKMNATGSRIDFNTSAKQATLRRLPWLMSLLLLGFISGGVISIFENTLQSVVALAFFMPMIAGMTGNTGTQSLAIVVRGLAQSNLNKSEVYRLIFRELRVGFFIGIVCGISVAVITYIWQANLPLSFVIGCSLLLTLIIGTMAGTIIPLILYRLKADPAVASGPLITTLNDIFSLFIYFGLASLFLMKI